MLTNEVEAPGRQALGQAGGEAQEGEEGAEAVPGMQRERALGAAPGELREKRE